MADLSIVLTAHREGILSGSTIRSALRAIERARAGGIVLEVVVVLDRADRPTRDILHHGFAALDGTPVRFIETDEGDPGAARNRGIEVAQGKAATFLDADDLVSENWFLAAASMIRQRPDAILHPAASLAFGQERHLWWHVDSESPLFDPLYLEWANYWIAISCARTELYRSHPFAPNALHAGFGHEDWHWNRVTLAAGHPHKPVPETLYFYRRRPGSQMAQVAAAGGVSWPLRAPRQNPQDLRRQ